MSDVVITCIILHNICIFSKNRFDSKWIQIGEDDLEQRINERVAMKLELRGKWAVIGEVRKRKRIGREGPSRIVENDHGAVAKAF